MIRTFKHAVTGRSIRVRKDSRAERLVEADANWTEIDDKPKGATRGTRKSGGRRGASGKVADSDGGNSASEPAE